MQTIFKATDIPLGQRSVKEKSFYIPSLDGIRALAVAMVFLAHAGVRWIPGGMGVTIFFFLSGYLITSLLRREYERSGSISFRKFYLRRVLRIWPPMYITLGFLLLATASGVLGNIRIEMRPLIFQLGHLTNYFRIYGHGHTIPGTGILWSLAVEEHFYLFFPLLLLGLFHLGCSRRNIALILAGICVLVLGWRCYLVYDQHVSLVRTYYATDCRIDSILFGCILGIYYNPYLDILHLKFKFLLPVILVLALTLMGATILPRSNSFQETIRYSLQGVALLPIFYIAVARHDWPVFTWLNWRAVRFVGTISYTIYLVHFFILYVAQYQLPRFSPIAQDLAAAAMTLLFATAMYYVVERPCAALRKRLHA